MAVFNKERYFPSHNKKYLYFQSDKFFIGLGKMILNTLPFLKDPLYYCVTPFQAKHESFPR